MEKTKKDLQLIIDNELRKYISDIKYHNIQFDVDTLNLEVETKNKNLPNMLKDITLNISRNIVKSKLSSIGFLLHKSCKNINGNLYRIKLLFGATALTHIN